jgi:signal transduction histidine kinase
MNHNSERSSNAMATSAVWMRDAVSLTTGQTQGLFHRPNYQQLNRELSLRWEERRSERARIARELHDTLFQGFLSASMVLHSAVEEMPADSPSKPSLNRALHLMRRVIDEGRHALQGLRSPEMAFTSLEQALANVRDEFTSGGTQFRILVMGQPKALKPAIQEQIYLIVREALLNAHRHSEATRIEADVEYQRRRLRVVVRDNGRGIDPQMLRLEGDSHWGLLGMHERARSIGAQLRIWSKRGAGTEVEISVPTDIAADVLAYAPKSPTLQNEAVA